jgi:hypothetical protein
MTRRFLSVVPASLVGMGLEFRHWLVTVDLVIADTIRLNLVINFCLFRPAKLDSPVPIFLGHLTHQRKSMLNGLIQIFRRRVHFLKTGMCAALLH